MFREKFGVLITAMVTPFNEDLSIDYKSLEKIICFKAGVGVCTVEVGAGDRNAANGRLWQPWLKNV